MAAGGQPVGVAVVARADSQEDFARFADHLANTPNNALSKAFVLTLGNVSGMAAGPDVFHPPPAGTIRVLVGPKP